MEKNTHTSTTNELTGWIPVLVRTADYALVTNLVAARESERLAESASGNNGARPIEGVDPILLASPVWPHDALVQLSESTTTTAKRWALAMDAIATGTENWYTTSQVAAMSGMTINEWRDAPRKITRHLTARYHGLPVNENGDNVWPLRAYTPKGSTEVSWGIPPENKRNWLEIRGL